MSVCSSRSRLSYQKSSSGLSYTDELSQIINIEKNYPEFASKSVKDLRNMIDKAEKSKDYNKIIDIQNYIDLRKIDNTSYITSVFQTWLKEGIVEAAENFDFNISQIEEERNNANEKLTKEYEESFEQNKNNNIDELNSLISLKDAEVEREKKRFSSEVRKLIDHSKKCAKANEMDLARKIQSEASEKQAVQVDERLKAVEVKYKNILAKLQQKQKNDYELIKAKFDESFWQIQKKYDDEIEQQKRTLSVYVLHSQQRAISEGSKKLVRKEMRSKMVNDLSQYVCKLVCDLEKEFIFDSLSSE